MSRIPIHMRGENKEIQDEDPETIQTRENEDTIQEDLTGEPEPQRRAVSRDDLRDQAKEEVDKDERYLRLAADFANYKRHAEAERTRLAEIGKEAVITDILPVLEHMENAVAAAEKHDRNRDLGKGLKMVQKELNVLLEKYGVERIETVGRPFDPQIHEAAAAIEADAEEGTIVHEVRPGFIKNGKVIRAAQVVVAK